MLKPLSKKTLEKKYAELGLSSEKLALLHRYFRAFSNLYGLIMIKTAWEVFKHYEGITYIHKKDLVAFAGVVQREADLPYHIIDIDEVFSKEKNTPETRLLVNNSLLDRGMYKFSDIYRLDEETTELQPFMPKKDTLLSFEEDKFYKTKAGKEFADYICALKTSGKAANWGNPINMTDINGNGVKGRRLDSFEYIIPYEQFDIDYCKRETDKNLLRQKYTKFASEKILDRVKKDILYATKYVTTPPIAALDLLDVDYGVVLSEKETEKFFTLYANLNNSSNLWCRFGWSPDELVKEYGIGMPKQISVGKNMKKMFENGELDEEELRKEFAKQGIELVIE